MRKFIFSFWAIATVFIAIISVPKAPLSYETTTLSYDSIRGAYGIEQQIQFATISEEQDNFTRFRYVDKVSRWNGGDLKPAEGMIVTCYYAPPKDIVMAGEVSVRKIRGILFLEAFLHGEMILFAGSIVLVFLLFCWCDCKMLKEKYFCRVRQIKYEPETGMYFVDQLYREEQDDILLFPNTLLQVVRITKVEIDKVIDLSTKKTVSFKEGDTITVLAHVGRPQVTAYTGDGISARQLIGRRRRQQRVRLALNLTVAVIWVMILINWIFFW